MKEGRYCATCANWFPIKSSATPRPAVLIASSGECHRYAPRPLLADRDAIKSPVLFWPTTGADDTCGEWYYGGSRLEMRASDETEPESPHVQESDEVVRSRENLLEAVSGPTQSPL